MPNCFISHATEDLRLAQVVRSVLEARGVTVFIASVSLRPGDNWSQEIRRNLLSSRCVIFLASSQACTSPFVQQELGMALGASKKLIPIIWDIDPSDLPGWVNQSQALDLRGGSMSDLKARVDDIARSIQMDKLGEILLLLVGALAAFVLLSPEKPT